MELLIVRTGRKKDNILAIEFCRAIQGVNNWVYITPCMAVNVAYPTELMDVCLDTKSKSWCIHRVAQLLEDGINVVISDDFINKEEVRNYICLGEKYKARINVINMANTAVQPVQIEV